MSMREEIHGVLMDGVEVKMPRYSQIQGRLWVGGLPAVQAPREFDFIINLNPGMNYLLHGPQIQVCNLMYDVKGIPSPMLCGKLVALAKSFLRQGPTLIHCREGLNRSPFIAALVLIENGMEPAAAVRLLKEKRHPRVFTNECYEQFLLQLEPGPKGS